MSKIWAIGDLHLDHTKEKSMDIFGENWKNHDSRIKENWNAFVEEEDVVLIPGDISWALKWEEAEEDLKLIDSLSGTKYLSKGNHDYWWTSLSKMNQKNWDSLFFIHNNSYITKNGIGICGTRGWIASDADDFKEEDEKIRNREILRLENSLKSLSQEAKFIIAMIHYPPFQQDFSRNEFTNLLGKYNVTCCIYGHLHGDGHKYVLNTNIDGVEYRCVSADYLNFKPLDLGDILWNEN